MLKPAAGWLLVSQQLTGFLLLSQTGHTGLRMADV
jgi:hypothetical protein